MAIARGGVPTGIAKDGSISNCVLQATVKTVLVAAGQESVTADRLLSHATVNPVLISLQL